VLKGRSLVLLYSIAGLRTPEIVNFFLALSNDGAELLIDLHSFILSESYELSVQRP
jgi:hypothetical protein